jgi:hypothetical protein
MARWSKTKVQVEGRDVYLVVGAKSETINVCNPDNVVGSYQTVYRVEGSYMLTLLSLENAVKQCDTLIALNSWLLNDRWARVEVGREPTGGLAYTPDLLRKLTIEALSDPSRLYRQQFVNFTSKFNNTRRYSDVVASVILDNLSKLHNISIITRQSSYKTETHTGEATTGRNIDTSDRFEEHLALSLYRKELAHIGQIIDYQVPLKNVQTDDAGKIDLLSYDKVSNRTTLLELKAPSAKDTLLRCVLEIYTYWKTVDRVKLLQDFVINADSEVRKAVFVPYNSQAFTDFSDKKCNKYTLDLMQKLGVDFFAFDVTCNIGNIKAF